MKNFVMTLIKSVRMEGRGGGGDASITLSTVVFEFRNQRLKKKTHFSTICERSSIVNHADEIYYKKIYFRKIILPVQKVYLFNFSTMLLCIRKMFFYFECTSSITVFNTLLDVDFPQAFSIVSCLVLLSFN